MGKKATHKGQRCHERRDIIRHCRDDIISLPNIQLDSPDNYQKAKPCILRYKKHDVLSIQQGENGDDTKKYSEKRHLQINKKGKKKKKHV